MFGFVVLAHFQEYLFLKLSVPFTIVTGAFNLDSGRRDLGHRLYFSC